MKLLPVVSPYSQRRKREAWKCTTYASLSQFRKAKYIFIHNKWSTLQGLACWSLKLAWLGNIECFRADLKWPYSKSPFSLHSLSESDSLKMVLFFTSKRTKTGAATGSGFSLFACIQHFWVKSQANPEAAPLRLVNVEMLADIFTTYIYFWKRFNIAWSLLSYTCSILGKKVLNHLIHLGGILMLSIKTKWNKGFWRCSRHKGVIHGFLTCAVITYKNMRLSWEKNQTENYGCRRAVIQSIFEYITTNQYTKAEKALETEMRARST